MYLADLHIHSRFSRATSRDCDIPHLDLWARRKGLALVGTGDFTHPAWREELRAKLVGQPGGFYTLRSEEMLDAGVGGDVPVPRFVLTSEISCIYKRHGKTRKVHNLILMPSLEAAELLSRKLEAIGNIHSDGRPILGLDSRDLLEITLDSCPEAVFVPAHIWTPHFSMFGAFSGFDSVEECFGDLAPMIHAVETGLSSDPPMNWRVSALDRFQLISNSDAHSPARLGREANLLDGPLTYEALSRALQTGDGLAGTVEFFPEEGKYHLDGHRNCKVRLTPGETQALDGRCPVCGRKLTIGVEHRVEELADRPAGFCRPDAKPFESLVPLPQILAASLGTGESSKKVQRAYEDLLHTLGPEFYILREAPLEDIRRAAGLCVAEGVRRVRAGQVQRVGGYDGEYGTISLFRAGEREELNGQMSLPVPTQAPAESPRPVFQKREAAREAKQPMPAGALNDRQQEAVEALQPAVAVVAGPGTGKTKTLVSHILYLIQSCGISPSQITAVTFTRMAAQEMTQRLEDALGSRQALRGLQIGTFHSLCLAMLPAPTMISNELALELARDVLAADGRKGSPRRFLDEVSRFKSGAEASEPEGFADYNAALAQRGLLDLDDVLLAALEQPLSAEQQQHLRFLLVDEFQDTNRIQFDLIQKWHTAGEHLFVIGDDDQSIYGFRGAGGGCFERLRETITPLREIRFEDNYRSSPAILESAVQLISHNPGPMRVLKAHQPDAADIRFVHAPSAYSEGIFIAKEIARMTGGVDMLAAQGKTEGTQRAFSDIAVLCRTHRQLDLVEECLLHDGIPCAITGRGDFLADESVRGAAGFFRHLLHLKDSLSLHAYLAGVLHCPPDLVRRAEEACAAASDWAALRAALGTDGWYGQWFAQADAFLPRVARERPHRLLEDFWHGQELRGARQRLLDTALFHKTMVSLLDTLLLGSEGDIVRASRKEYASGAVRLMTLHGAKGLEFPVVFLAGLSAGTIPLQDGRSPLEEERRLFYVGMTRAREELVLSGTGDASVFLKELQTSRLHRENAPEYVHLPSAQQMSFL